jgi:Phage P22-like portal protein
MPKKSNAKPLRSETPPRKKTPLEESQTADQAALTLAKARFKQAFEADTEWRKGCLEDLKFSLGDQWPDAIKNARMGEDAPCLTINRIAGFLRMICNDQRSQHQAIQISPVGSGADVDTAKIMQGYARHVEQRSDADTVYDTTFEQMARAGFGFARVLTEYADEESLDLDCVIEGIKNQFTVYFDPAAKKPDYSDAEWCFIVENMQNDEYRAEYPDSALAGLNDWRSVGDQNSLWMTHDTTRVAEYFYIEKKPYTLVRTKDGSVFEESELPKGMSAVETRRRFRRTVKWAKINCVEFLDKKDWPGKYIPVVPDLGDDFDVDGKRYLAGAVRNPKDAQRAYNFWITSASETIALAPKSPWLLASGQQEGFEKLWEHANTRRLSTLIWNPKAKGANGEMLPPPVRNQSEPPIEAMGKMIGQADNDLKATFGIFDASLGQKGPEVSGEAILARQKQSDVAILNFTDNHARFLRQIGKIIVDLMSKIVTEPRMQRIINPDGSVKHVGIYNSQFDEEADARERLLELGADNDAIKRIYDVGVGDYDVVISSGPSYQTKRQESATAMMEMVNAYPQLMQAAADLIIKEMDWPGAEAIAERLKKMIPPQLLNSDVTDGDPKQALQLAQSQLQQMMQSHDLLAKELTAAAGVIRDKKIENDAKYQIALLQSQTQLLMQQAKTQGEGAMAALNAQLGTIAHLMEQVHEQLFVEEQTPSAEQPPTVQEPAPKKPDLSQALLPPQPVQPMNGQQ